MVSEFSPGFFIRILYYCFIFAADGMGRNPEVVQSVLDSGVFRIVSGFIQGFLIFGS